MSRGDYAAAFWAKTALGAGGCVIWTGCKSTNGYGKTPDQRLAHRVAFELATGTEPGRLHVLHSCDNPPCCNPAHLFLGTAGDNMKDAARKGRHRLQHITHCINGHEFTPENTLWRRGKVRSRTCRACAKARSQAFAARKAVAQ